MNSAKRYLVIALSFAVCMTVFAAFAPRIAHAITATMVQVVNTPSTPVPTQPVHARQAVRLYCVANVLNAQGLELTCDLADAVSGNLYIVPANKRLVVDFYSARVSLSNSVQFAYIRLASSDGIQQAYFPPGTAALDGSSIGGVSYAEVSPTTLFIDSGNTIHAAARLNNAPPDNSLVDLRVQGHLEDLQ